jgi:hypothetical protein
MRIEPLGPGLRLKKIPMLSMTLGSNAAASSPGRCPCAPNINGKLPKAP